jgi:hypothetical protein
MVIQQSVRRMVKNFIGYSGHVTGCLGCGDNYIWKKFHEIIYNDLGDGMIPYCEECHNQLSIERKKELVSQLVDKWRKSEKADRNFLSIERQAHDAVMTESNLLTG